MASLLRLVRHELQIARPSENEETGRSFRQALQYLVSPDILFPETLFHEGVKRDFYGFAEHFEVNLGLFRRYTEQFS